MKKRIIKLEGICLGYIKSYSEFTKEIYSHYSDVQRRAVVFCNVILSLYLTTIIFLHNSISNSLRITLFSVPLLIFSSYQLFKLFLLKHDKIYIFARKERSTLSQKTFFFTAAIVFTIFILNLFANYPGGISPDVIEQWNQVQSGNFHNWHPAIYTMIIWLVTRIIPTYSFFLFFQILIFSLLVGYMAATIEAWGINKLWIIIFIVAILTNNNKNIIYH